MSALDFEWLPEWKPSWLVLKQYGPHKAKVIRVDPRAILGPGKARIYDGWYKGERVYNAEDEFTVGQILDL